MSASTNETADTLSQLAVGERFWFWLCTRVEGNHPVLLAQPLASDPGMTTLTAEARRAPLQLGAVPLTGLGSIGEDGHVRMSSPLASADQLAGLARWVRAEVDEHPGLARLKNTMFLNISPGGTVRAIHQEPDLWEGVPDALVPGSLAESAMRLARLKAGRSCWFWLAERGPDDSPHLYLHSARRDPEGAAFVDAVLQLRRKATGNGTELRGQLHRTEGGTLMFTSQDEVQGGLPIFQALMAANEPLAEALSSALLVQSRGDTFIKIARIEAAGAGLDLSEQASVLSLLQSPSDKAMFWLCSVKDTPHLLLSESRDGLKASVKSSGLKGESVRGQVVVSSKGWLEFRVRAPYPDFIEQLAAWALAHHAAWPALKRLRGARMTQRGNDGEIVSRQKNDNAWSSL